MLNFDLFTDEIYFLRISNTYQGLLYSSVWSNEPFCLGAKIRNLISILDNLAISNNLLKSLDLGRTRNSNSAHSPDKATQVGQKHFEIVFELWMLQPFNFGFAWMYLQLPLRQWGAGNVYLLVLSSWKVNIAENHIVPLTHHIIFKIFL